MEENKNRKNSWPTRNKLQESIDVFEEFRAICKFQLELGYWVTLDFPSKHHINKILLIQYMDEETLNKNYGEGLIARAKYVIPFCKHYLAMVRDGAEK